MHSQTSFATICCWVTQLEELHELPQLDKDFLVFAVDDDMSSIIEEIEASEDAREDPQTKDDA